VLVLVLTLDDPGPRGHVSGAVMSLMAASPAG
jgi:hypothetical protein